MSIAKIGKPLAATAVAITVAVGGFTVAAAAPAQAASCSVNYYYVNYAPAGVYENPGSGWLKNKVFGDSVTGPNSNVKDNYVNGWRAVYTQDARDGEGWMWADNLTYLRCR